MVNIIIFEVNETLPPIDLTPKSSHKDEVKSAKYDIAVILTTKTNKSLDIPEFFAISLKTPTALTKYDTEQIINNIPVDIADRPAKSEPFDFK